MLTCQQLVELVTAYLDHQMGWWDRLQFQAHIALCPHCQAYVQQMRTTVAALGHVPDLELPPDIEREMLDHFSNWKKTDSQP